MEEDSSKEGSARLCVAAREFEIVPELDGLTDVRHGGKATEIASGLKTTVFLFEERGETLCLITTHFGPSIPVNVSKLFRETIAAELKIPVSRVLIFTSHNHTSVAFASNGVLAFNAYETAAPAAELLPVGIQFLTALRDSASSLRESLEPVSVWWGEGREDRITYYRKGRKDNGSTYLMREEDRRLLGDDYRGDVDFQAPLVVFKNDSGKAVAGLAQYTGHPVTAFHPENTVVFGEWPQVACDRVSDEIGAPVGFIQGCAGDVNSKEMFTGGVKRSREFGEMLGESYLKVLDKLKKSDRGGFQAGVESVGLPLGPLPSLEVLEAELEEIDDFIGRAEAGDGDTLTCVGQNFPEALTPKYRAWLVGIVRPWTEWAIDLVRAGKAGTVAKTQEMEIAVIRIGDVGIVGLPCEPFQNIGRLIRKYSPLPMAIPCGYMNINHGYIVDSTNLGDKEYMSAHHRYTKFRAPLKSPAGDVLADAGVKLLERFTKDV